MRHIKIVNLVTIKLCRIACKINNYYSNISAKSVVINKQLLCLQSIKNVSAINYVKTLHYDEINKVEH